MTTKALWRHIAMTPHPAYHAILVLAATMMTLMQCLVVCAWVPPVYNETVIHAFSIKELLNPLPPLDENPYTIPNFNTTWPNSVCAVRYPNIHNRSTYFLETYETAQAAEAAGAFVTHLHPCGYCSTTRDLSIYMAYPDLTDPVRDCALVSFVNQSWSQECLVKIGFTPECALIWLYDALNTRAECFTPCVTDWLENVTNNVPPNSTNLNPCLQCDEDMSGPIFKVVAGRTRRDSGIQSAINRPPDSIYNITHYYY